MGSLSAKVDFLKTDSAQAALGVLKAQVLDEAATLSRLGHLRRQFSPEQAGWLLTLARLRQKAAGKFSRAEHMYFSAEALEQASAEVVSRTRARRFAGCNKVWDLGCGIGGDTLALATAGAQVVAVDHEFERLQMACLNAAVYDQTERVAGLCADWTQQSFHADAAFADPGRRKNGKRVFSVEYYEPPLSQVLALQNRVQGLCVKLSPGVDYAELPHDAEIEFISVQGELREAVLWLGDLRTKVHRRATLLQNGVEYSLASDQQEPQTSVGAPATYLYEPDPAIIRSHLIGVLAAHHGWHLMDDQIAYLTNENLVQSPFVKAFQVVEHAPFNLKALNRRLRSLHVGATVVKKRGLAIDPDAFGHRLNHEPGGWEATVILTRVADKPWMLITRRITNP